MSTLFGKRAEKILSVVLSLTVIVWSLGLFALTATVASAATLKEGDIIRGPDGIKVYIINNNGYKRHIFNPEVFNMYGHLKWSNIKAVDQATLDSYKTSDLYRAENDPKVYSTTNDGKKSWLNMTGDQFIAAGYSFGQVFSINTKEANFYATGADITSGTQPVVAVTPGTLNVSLDSSNPAAATLVADTTSGDGAQALAPVMKLNFTGAGKVTSIKLKRSGISADTDVSNMYLYDGDTYLADSPIVASTVFSFTNSAGLFTVNGSKTITVKMDLANGTGAGKTIQFSVNTASDIASDATSLGGTFPITGNVMSTATAADLGKITLAQAATPGSTIDAGLTEQELWRFSLAAADQKIKISQIKVTAIGTLNAGDIANFKLHDGTNYLGSTVAAMNSDKTVTFTLSPAYEIASGQTKNISFRGDIVSGSSRNYYFEIAGARDIVAMDGNYGVALKINQSNTYSIIPASATTTTINSGSLSINRASDSASGNIAKDGTNIKLAKFSVKANGEAIKVNSFTVNTIAAGTTDGTVAYAAQGLNDGKILLDGAQIGTTTDLVTAATTGGDTAFTFGNSFIVNAGQTRVLEIVSDVKLADATSFGASTTATVTASIKVNTINAIRQSSGTSITTNSAVSGNNLSVSAAAISAGLNQTLANMNVVAGQTGVTIGSWLLTAGSAEGIDVSTVALTDGSGTGAKGWGSAFNNVKLYSGSTQLGSTQTNPTSTDASALTFNLSTPMRIAAGQSKQVDLVADVITGASWDTSNTYTFINSITGTGVNTNASVTQTYTAGGVSTAQNITVASSGTLTVAVSAAPTNPSAQYLVAGDTAQTVAAWKFSADNVEDLKVTRIKLKQAQSDVNAVKNAKNLALYVGSTQVGATIAALTDPSSSVSADEYAIFEDTTNGLFTVPKNSNVTVTLKMDVTPATNASFNSSGTGTNNGTAIKFQVTNATTMSSTSDISAKGSLSGTFAAGADSSNYAGNSHIVVKTKPTFALDSSTSSSLLPGVVEVIRFTITAHSANDVTFDGTNHNIRFTRTMSGTLTGTTVDLYDASTNTTIATQVSNGATINFSTVNTTVPAGTTKTYYVKADLAGLTTAGNSFQLTLNNAAADLSWSDGVTSSDITNANMSNVGLPISGKVIVKP